MTTLLKKNRYDDCSIIFAKGSQKYVYIYVSDEFFEDVSGAILYICKQLAEQLGGDRKEIKFYKIVPFLPIHDNASLEDIIALSITELIVNPWKDNE